jgi:hypothetical protein
MSSHRFSPDIARIVLPRLEAYRSFDAGYDTATGEVVVDLLPDLTPGEQAILDRLVRWAQTRLPTEPAGFDAVREDGLLLRDYHALAAPTNAQSVAAIKALIRVLRWTLTDSS